MGRVANRIGGAKFELNGQLYKTDPNEGHNTLHGTSFSVYYFWNISFQSDIKMLLMVISGGTKGFGDVIWSVENYVPTSHITFIYHSFDGEEGNTIYIW